MVGDRVLFSVGIVSEELFGEHMKNANIYLCLVMNGQEDFSE